MISIMVYISGREQMGAGDTAVVGTYIEGVCAGVGVVALHGGDGSSKELPRGILELQDLGGRYLAQDRLQRCAVGSQEEELLPEAL